jgi:hypothetical protein
MLVTHEINQCNNQEILSPEQKWSSFREIFTAIRDIPYSNCKSISKPKTLDEYLGDFILNIKRGSCTPKHLLLGLAAETIGMHVQYLSYQFYWRNLLVEYPSEIREFLKKMPAQLHTSIAVSPYSERHGKHYLIDCTWDRSLASVGFPVNNLEIIPNHCKMGIIPHTTPIVHYSAKEKWQYVQEIKSTIPLNKNVSMFYEGFNDWLTTLRSQLISYERQDNNNSPSAASPSLIAIAQFGIY